MYEARIMLIIIAAILILTDHYLAGMLVAFLWMLTRRR